MDLRRPRLNSLHTALCTALLTAVASLAQTPTQTPTQPPATPDAPPQTTIAQNAPLNRALPTLFIVGDSTARNQADLGWGDHLAHYFDTTKINIANRARAGRSSRTFINEGSWDKMLAEMKPGDYVLIQMGHNDGGDLSGAKPRGSLKGIGNEEQQITLPDGHEELVHTYGWYIRHYIEDTRGEQATPILLSLTIRNIWKDGKIERDMGYDAEIHQLAKDQDVAFVDMATVEADRLEALGPEKTALLFPIDHTHTSAEGAEGNAESVVIALRNAKSPLVAYLKPSNSGSH
jgi:rhamnogalacturonan acetylesterase